MPNTVNIERHKLNQAMYQKLKRYIMSKRKRELEEKAQDDHFKKLRREREERKLQAEFDAEDLEKTRCELQATRAKIEELTARRNELFQRWKQLGSEESNLKEKQRHETLTLLAGMPTTQFGLNPSGLGNAARTAIPNSAPRTQTPVHIQTAQLPHLPQSKQFGGMGTGILGPCVNLPAQHLLHAHYPNLTTRESTSPHRGIPGAVPYCKPSQVPVSVSSALPSGIASLPATTLANNHAAAVAAVAAAIAAHHRTGTPTDSNFSTQSVKRNPPMSSIFANTAAAAAYLNAIVSLTSTPPTSVPSLAHAPLGVLNPNSAGFNEALAALAASGFYSVPSLPPTSSSAHGGSLGHRASPTSVSLPDGSFTKNGRAAAASQAAAAAAVALAQQTAGLSKGFPAGQRHPTAGAMDSSCSPTITTSTVSAAAPSTSLPPAPISYRGSITTGQSAQQIQLQQQQHQQQAHQKQQQQLLSKFTLPSEYASMRVPNSAQAGDGSTNANVTRPVMNTTRLTDAAAFMASIGVTSSSALLNAAVLQSAFPSSTSSSAGLPPPQSPVALTAVLAPYSTDVNLFSYHNTATIAASLQQHQQQLQKMNLPTSSSPHPRASPAASSAPPTANPPSTTRHFF